MLRSLVVWTAALALLGCKSGASVVDPFVGKTKVEPPRTGTVTSPPGDPYYAAPRGTPGAWSPTSPGTNTAPPGANSAVPPAGTAPAGGPALRNGATRPPAFEANRSSAAIRIPAPTASDGTGDRYPDYSAHTTTAATAPADRSAPAAVPAARIAASEPAAPAASATSREPVIRVIEPRSPPPTAVASSPEPRPLDPRSVGTASPIATTDPANGNSPSIDLASLSSTGGGAAGAAASPSTASHGVQFASATAPGVAAGCACQATPADATLQPTPDAATSGAGYAHDPQYQWLRGVLEFSPAERAWRVRYIAPGQSADKLGGSVVLANVTALTGLERGQAVEVRGRLVQRANGRCVATAFEASEIRALTGQPAKLP